MAENTKIEWVDHTFNPWIGCTKIIGGPEGSACDNCYAAAMSHRRGWARFEAGAPRKRTTTAYWRQPLLWNKKAAAAGRRAKVFGPSLADPYDAEIGDDWRNEYMDLIEACAWLDFILLTKRPQVALKFHRHRRVPDNLWPGITAENQNMLDLRAPVICSIPAKVHVLSAEPLLGILDARRYLGRGVHSLSWVITGGESGPKARPSNPEGFRSLRDQCAEVDVPYFHKQNGEWIDYRQLGADAWGFTHERKGVRYGNLWRDGIALFGGKSFEARYPFNTEVTGPCMVRVGKKISGAKLEGVEHRAAPP